MVNPAVQVIEHECQLDPCTQRAGLDAQVGLAVLVNSLIARVAAMTAAQSFGFFSWPIFQTVFADATPGPRNSVGPGIPLARKTRGEPPAATPSDP